MSENRTSKICKNIYFNSQVVVFELLMNDITCKFESKCLLSRWIWVSVFSYLNESQLWIGLQIFCENSYYYSTTIFSLQAFLPWSEWCGSREVWSLKKTQLRYIRRECGQWINSGRWGKLKQTNRQIGLGLARKQIIMEPTGNK